MGKQIEREETTKFATDKINQMLDAKDYTSAVLLASIYVDMRIRTIIALKLDSSGENFEKISDTLDYELGFRNLISLCKNIGKIDKDVADKLGKLYGKRCKVAHDSELWKKVPEKDQKEITDYCEAAINFLKNSNNL